MCTRLFHFQFWNNEKDTDRLESTIFEDLDRYCWATSANTTHVAPPNATHHLEHTLLSAVQDSRIDLNTTTTTTNHTNTNTNNNNSHSNSHCGMPTVTSASNLTLTSTSATAVTPAPPLSNDEHLSANAISTNSSDGQIYTLTVLNGAESWLKREVDTQLNSSLDLDSILGTFPGYIKSEYPYDDSGFCTDVAKESTVISLNSSAVGDVSVTGNSSGNSSSATGAPNTSVGVGVVCSTPTTAITEGAVGLDGSGLDAMDHSVNVGGIGPENTVNTVLPTVVLANSHPSFPTLLSGLSTTNNGPGVAEHRCNPLADNGIGRDHDNANTLTNGVADNQLLTSKNLVSFQNPNNNSNNNNTNHNNNNNSWHITDHNIEQVIIQETG